MPPQVIWIVGSSLFVVLLFWLGIRSIRWAKRRSSSAALLGYALQIPAAGINPEPPPQERIEEAMLEVQGKQSDDAADGSND